MDFPLNDIKTYSVDRILNDIFKFCVLLLFFDNIKFKSFA